jgi:hypothetical protein
VKKIVGLFKHEHEADRAIRELQKVGFSRSIQDEQKNHF